MRYLLCSAAVLALAACGQNESADTSAVENTSQEVAANEDSAAVSAEEKLDAVLAAQSEDIKARYQYRHPKETLMFFGIEPGMTVVDTLPGSFWYAGLLSQYLGEEGRVIGADYSLAHRMDIGGRYASDEWQAENKNWPIDWVMKQEADRVEGGAPYSAFFYGSLPEDMYGQADAVLMVRAVHHFNRLEEKGGYFTEAFQDAMNILKPGGTLGIVQHRAPEANSDEWAVGDNGYLKQAQLIAAIEATGFDFIEASEINANPNDVPTEEDFVWRLPPSLATSRDNPELRAEMQAIGETDRMTLKFRKPE